MAKITFLGAGSVVFTRQLLTDLYRFEDLPAVEICLYDIDPERLEVALETARNVAQQLGVEPQVSATGVLKEALVSAQFVVNMIQVEGVEGTRKDLSVPFDYGLTQTIGDTTGVGGIFRGLRTFPVLSEFAATMEQVCPDALFLNYTNPMCMNVWWMSKVAPSIKAYGLCHSVHWTAHDLSELIGVPFDEVTYEAAGVNHQAWLTKWERNGESLYPVLDQYIADHPQMLRRVRVEIYRRIGFYPTETSEHSSEYLDWFLRSPEQVRKYRIKPLQYLGESEEIVEEFAEARRALDAGEGLPLHDEGAEYAPQIIHSILTGTPRHIHVNVPNDELIDNLPQGAVVEVPAIVDGNGITPMHYGRIPLIGMALNRTYLSVAEMTVEAALVGDRELVKQAALIDPNASSTLTPDQIWQLCEELFEAHRDYLPKSLR